MTFGREKRWLLGLAAALAPLPLPFNEIVGWVPLGLFEAAMALFLVRAARDDGAWLPYWAMNVLAVAYLPFIALDFSVFWRGQILQPLVNLVLFALAVKLFGLHREADKWHAFLAVFFLFVTAMGTSVHPSVIVYFVAALTCLLLILARFATAHLLDRHGYAGAGTGVVPLRGFLVPAAMLSILLAMPIFAILPRFQNPYIVAPGGGGGGRVQSGGFRDSFELDSVGRARLDRSVVLRLRYEATPPPGHAARFKAAVYERFEDRSWTRVRGGFEPVRRGPGGVFELAAAREWGWMEIWLLAQNRPELVLPVETVALDVAATRVAVSATGLVALPVVPPGTLRYRVALAGQPVLPAAADVGEDLAPELDVSGLSPRIVELATEVMGEGEAVERARRAERFLHQEFTYSLDAGPRELADPIEDFLLRSRSGHCELFATSMVLMLRSQGIPARLVSGYLGAEFNALEGYFMVRNSNAHAWVEAHTPEGGWQIFDPTPPDGLPQPAATGLLSLAGQAWDYLVFRWDRYVLSYGFYDQAQAFWRLRGLWVGLRGWLFGDEKAPAGSARPPEPEEAAETVEPTAGPDEPPFPVWLPLLALLAVALAVWRWRRPVFTATLAYRRLRARLAGGGVAVDPSTPPLAVARLLAERRPQAAETGAALVDLYLSESFGGRRLDSEELEGARTLLRLTLRELGRRSGEPADREARAA